MSLNSYLELKNETTITLLLIIFSFVVRVPIIFIFGDAGIENEWTPLLSNLVNYKTLSVVQIEVFGFLLPNLLMPPLYGYYLYFFSLFNLEYQNFIQLILFSHIFFGRSRKNLPIFGRFFVRSLTKKIKIVYTH